MSGITPVRLDRSLPINYGTLRPLQPEGNKYQLIPLQKQGPLNEELRFQDSTAALKLCILTLPEGEYKGEAFDKRPHGYGEFNYTNGEKFRGTWRHGKKHGEGIYSWPNGQIYTGEFKEDRIEGRGKLVRITGDEEIGQFRDGELYIGVVQPGVALVRIVNKVERKKTFAEHLSRFFTCFKKTDSLDLHKT